MNIKNISSKEIYYQFPKFVDSPEPKYLPIIL